MMRAFDFRARARQALTEHWVLAVVAGIIVTLVTNTSIGGFKLQVDFNATEIGMLAGIDLPPFVSQEESLSLAEIWLPVSMGVLLVLVPVCALLSIVVRSPLAVGYASFNLGLIDGRDPELEELVSYYRRIKTIVWAEVLRALHIIGGTLLFIIPGIIVSYSYRMTEYVLAEHPELTAKEALEMSDQMMDGNRWRLFCLEFSFFGWNILSMFTLGIANFWVFPYQEAARAVFYRSLTPPTDPISMAE